jgi:hypothetical protein
MIISEVPETALRITFTTNFRELQAFTLKTTSQHPLSYQPGVVI